MTNLATLPLREAPTPAEEQLANTIVGKVDRRFSPIFARASDQQYTELDRPKDPFTDAVDGNKIEGHDYNIFTDGKLEYTNTFTDTNKQTQLHFKITGYNYVIKQSIVRDKSGQVKSMSQAITCKSYKVKVMCQHLLNLPIG